MSQIKERRENTPANLHGTGFLHYPSPVGMPVPETLGTRCKSSCHVPMFYLLQSHFLWKKKIRLYVL